MSEDPEIAEFRELFPVTRQWNYLYNGAIHPCPRPVGEAMREFIREWEDGGRDAWPPAFEKFQLLKEKFGALTGTSSRNIVITDSTSSAINLAAGILKPDPGSNIVVSDLTFMSDSYAWMGSHPELEVRFVENRGGLVRPADIANQVDRNTAAVNLCAVTAGNGFRFDLSQVYDCLPLPRPPLLIDASQAVGVVRLDVTAPPLDFLACTAGKWLMGPLGVAFLYVSDGFLDAVPPAAGWLAAANNRDWDVRNCILHQDAMRFQCGIPNLVGAVGALAALKLIEQIGIDFIEKRVSGLTTYAIEKLDRLGLEVLTPSDPGKRAGLVFFRLPEAKELYFELHRSGIYCGCFMGGIRIDPNFYNTYEEIDQFAAVVEEFVKEKKG